MSVVCEIDALLPPPPKCDMCGIADKQLFSHHVIPRIYGGENKDIIQVCQHCHGLADGKFRRFIYDPFDLMKYWKDPLKTKDYNAKYIGQKMIYYLNLEDTCGIDLMLRYNTKTNRIGVSGGRHYNKRCKGRYSVKSIYYLTIEPNLVLKINVLYHNKIGNCLIVGHCYSRNRMTNHVNRMYRI